jgi:nitroreductase
MTDTPDTVDKTAVTRAPIHDLLARRHSSRAFSDRPVSPEIVLSLMEAARWSASSNNEQPWRFIVATRDDPEAHQQMLSCVNPSNQRWAPPAWVLMIGIARDSFDVDGNPPNRFSAYDTGQAVQNMVVQATAHGLNVRQMGGILPERIRELYQVPEGYTIMAGLAIGYPGDPDQLVSPLKEREALPRTRKPLSALFFGGSFGQSHPLADADEQP